MSGKPFVMVLGGDGRPVMPCTGKRARLLLTRKRAVVVRRIPFVIQLKDRNSETCEVQPLIAKVDPGSKTTGIAVVRRKAQFKDVVVINLIELTHRDEQIKRRLKARRILRRARRQRKTRYRAPRFLNRDKPKGWIGPSLMHRVHTTLSWIRRLRRWMPIAELAVERVKFDTQKLQNPEISGVTYQQGTLFGYEVREYLLEKFNRRCVYCGTQDVTRFEVDHVIPRSRGGGDRISNLVLSCHPCNRAKGNLSLEVFIPNAAQREQIKRQLKRSLRDAAAMNATRNKLIAVMQETSLPIETGTGGQTKYNRCRLKIPKTHALDAVCVSVISQVHYHQRPTLQIKAVGRGRYQRAITDKYDFPKAHRARKKQAFGFQTGDLVCGSNHRGDHIGHVVIRQSGMFNIDLGDRAESVSYRKCRLIQKADGYRYTLRL